MAYVVGIDGGGTKTVGILADDTGKVISRVELGPSNYHVVGARETEKVLKDVVDSFNIPIETCEAFCLGMAGLGRPEDRKVIGQACSRLGFQKNLILTHDAKIALVGGAVEGYGVIIIAGTGSIVYGINEIGVEKRAGGWGHILGDEGSGYDIARNALQAIFRAHDDRARKTMLTDKILRRLDLAKPEQLVQWAYATDKGGIAALASSVFDAWAENDSVAQKIIHDAADELILTTQAVVKNLKMATDAFDIVFSGGIFAHQPNFVKLLQKDLRDIAPRAKTGLPQREPAYGAVLLAVRSSAIHCVLRPAAMNCLTTNQ